MTYVSSARDLMEDAELADLLRVSRRNNIEAGITGMLLYQEGNFLQVLEGPEKAITATSARIERDGRHTGMLTLLREPISERQFPNWSMAFQNLTSLSDEDKAGFSDFLVEPLSANIFRDRPERAYKLLLSFRDRMR